MYHNHVFSKTEEKFQFSSEKSVFRAVGIVVYEPHHEKTGFCICENKDAFVFATRIVKYLYFLNTKFHASSHLL